MQKFQGKGKNFRRYNYKKKKKTRRLKKGTVRYGWTVIQNNIVYLKPTPQKIVKGHRINEKEK